MGATVDHHMYPTIYIIWVHPTIYMVACYYIYGGYMGDTMKVCYKEAWICKYQRQYGGILLQYVYMVASYYKHGGYMEDTLMVCSKIVTHNINLRMYRKP